MSVSAPMESFDAVMKELELQADRPNHSLRKAATEYFNKNESNKLAKYCFDKIKEEKSRGKWKGFSQKRQAKKAFQSRWSRDKGSKKQELESPPKRRSNGPNKPFPLTIDYNSACDKSDRSNPSRLPPGIGTSNTPPAPVKNRFSNLVGKRAPQPSRFPPQDRKRFPEPSAKPDRRFPEPSPKLDRFGPHQQNEPLSLTALINNHNNMAHAVNSAQNHMQIQHFPDAPKKRNYPKPQVPELQNKPQFPGIQNKLQHPNKRNVQPENLPTSIANILQMPTTPRKPSQNSKVLHEQEKKRTEIKEIKKRMDEMKQELERLKAINEELSTTNKYLKSLVPMEKTKPPKKVVAKEDSNEASFPKIRVKAFSANSQNSSSLNAKSEAFEPKRKMNPDSKVFKPSSDGSKSKSRELSGDAVEFKPQQKSRELDECDFVPPLPQMRRSPLALPSVDSRSFDLREREALEREMMIRQEMELERMLERDLIEREFAHRSPRGPMHIHQDEMLHQLPRRPGRRMDPREADLRREYERALMEEEYHAEMRLFHEFQHELALERQLQDMRSPRRQRKGGRLRR